MELKFIKWFIAAVVALPALVFVESAYTTYAVTQCKLAYAATDRKTEDIRQICNR